MAKKSYTKRIKVTKSGKLLRRKKGLAHNKAKRKGKAIRQKRNLKRVSGVDRSNIGGNLTT
ncbi:MAG: 50S ribosomal protein L35 [bacterium]|nr:50S ribosomal protein L35 [bacterium]MDZ4231463.1 50S ribosomal protein L35 [Patescibacteria group bacterium]